MTPVLAHSTAELAARNRRIPFRERRGGWAFDSCDTRLHNFTLDLKVEFKVQIEEIVIMQDKNGLATIGQIAEAVGVATSTLRYYEREGLLEPADRSPAGYRLYEPRAIDQLRFIRSAQSVGFSLEDIKALLALNARTSCKQVQVLIEERLADVSQRIADLKSVQDTLNRTLNRCRKSRKGCPILSELRHTDQRQKR